MTSDHPHTPQSPSQTSFGALDLPAKPATSPRQHNSLPTPAHSINGSMSSLGTDTALEGALLEEASNKRKRDFEDHGDRDQKKVHIEDGEFSRLSIKDLHVNVGPKYLLCRTPHPKKQVEFDTDFFERLGLNDLAKSVARKDSSNPNGKAIRKSYKAVFKTISGNFHVDKKELDAEDTLIEMMRVPQEAWDAKFAGNEIGKGLSEPTLASMGKAFTMTRGSIPKASWDSAVLGEVAAPAAPAKVAKPASHAVKAPHAQVAGVPQAAKEIPRPKRNVKKRAYGDSSFEGYGEGYVDDDMQDTGYSTGDGEDRSGSRKRPKKTSTSHGNFQQGPMRQNSYGPGMVGA